MNNTYKWTEMIRREENCHNQWVLFFIFMTYTGLKYVLVVTAILLFLPLNILERVYEGSFLL